VQALDALLVELATRKRKAGVTTLLVNGSGRSWKPDQLTREVAIVRNSIGIFHVDEETGLQRRKNLHDLRGTYVTKLIAETTLTDEEIARIMGWAPATVETIRAVYVDQDTYASALGNRIPYRTFAGSP
jgi:hypothetical protein